MNWSIDVIEHVWRKATEEPGANPDVWRRDRFGRLIRRGDYGNRESPFGWEIDHHPVPKARGGSDKVENLKPLHWHPNAAKGDKSDVAAVRSGSLSSMGALFGLADPAAPAPDRELLAAILRNSSK